MKKKQSEVYFQRPEARRVGLLMSDAAIQRCVAKWSDEDHTSLLKLCKRYGIGESPAMFYELSLALARELYPERKRRGPGTKWTALNQGALVVEIERLAKPDDPARGVAWAAAQLSKREPWKSFLESGATSRDPAIFAKQANVTTGPQQVNNGIPSRARETEIEPNRLLEAQHRERLDFGTSGAAIGAHPAMATLGELDGAADAGR